MLAGATAYAVGEGRQWPGWRASPRKRLPSGVLALSAGVGIVLNFTPMNPISALYWSAVINGVLAVPVMVLLMFMAQRQDVMGRFVVRGPLYWLGWLSTLAMLLSVVAMWITISSGAARRPRHRPHPGGAAWPRLEGWAAGLMVPTALCAPPHHEGRLGIFRNTIEAIRAGHQRRQGGDKSVDEAMLLRGGGDELFEADFHDFERGVHFRRRPPSANGLNIHRIGPDRRLRRQWNSGAEQHGVRNVTADVSSR